MTQLPDEGAVGGSNDEPIIAAEPTIEDRFAAFTDEPQAEEESGEQRQAEEGEPELTVDDIEEEEAELPPIPAPVSWKDEEKEEFRQLPRALQETLTRREAEREKFVQSKAQEAATARSQAEREALGHIQQIQMQNAQALQSLLVEVPAEPSFRLQNEDPDLFAERMDAHKNAAAHNQWVEQRVIEATRTAQAAAQRHEAETQAQAQAEFQAVLSQNLPEFFDPEAGPKLQQQLTSIALELGFSAENVHSADANDILAIKKASDWKAKADKYDTLMAKRMEKVREAKNMPKVSRPGVPQGKGAVANERYQSDRQAMKQGDRDAAVRVFSRFV